MLIINNNLTTENPDVVKAIKNNDSDFIKQTILEAEKDGFNALQLNAINSDNEADDLLFLVKSAEESGLTLILSIKDNSVFDKVIPQMITSGIVNPIDITLTEADKLFPLLKKLEDDWKVLFTQDYGEDTVSNEIEGSKEVISKAEQEGILPERIYVEPLTEPLRLSNNSYVKMKRILDAFSNSYPSMNFYINLPLATDGLKDQLSLVNSFIAMSIQIGIEAFALDFNHKEHIQTINAALALLNQDGGISDYLKK